MEMDDKTKGVIENLEYRIRQLKESSKDVFFTQYLDELNLRVQSRKYEISLFVEELDRNYKIYCERNNTIEQSEIPHVQDEMSSVAGKDIENGLKAYNVYGEYHPEQQPINESQHDMQLNQDVQPDMQLNQYVQPDMQLNQDVQPDMQLNQDAQPDMQLNQDAQQNMQLNRDIQSDIQLNRDVQPALPPVYTTWPEPSRKKNHAEFVIGASVLGVIGGVFILAALVMLGMNFMNGFFKGMCLYAGCIVVLLISELIVYRRLPKFGSILSSVSIGGLYLSTAVNFLALQNFDMWVAFVVTLFITVFTIILTRVRGRIIYRVIGITAGFTSFMMIQKGMDSTGFLVVCAMLFFMNTAFLAIPVEKKYNAVNIFHISANSIFALIFSMRADLIGIDKWPLMIYITSSVLIMHLIFIMHAYKTKSAEGEKNVGLKVSYMISSVVYASLIGFWMFEEINDIYLFASLFCGMSAIMFLVALALKIQEKWYIYSFTGLFAYIIMTNTELEWAICLLSLIAITKLTLLITDSYVIKYFDGIVTFLVCANLVFADGIYAWLLLAGVFIGVLFMCKCQTYNSILFTSALSVYAAVNMPHILKLPTAVGIIFVGLLLCNHFKRYHDKYIMVYNSLAFVGQSVCFVALINPVYRNAYITYLCMLVFGIATIVIMLQKRYNMEFKYRNLVLAVFLTYMGFIFKSSIPVLNSIILMLIAMVSVGIGWSYMQKPVRVYGLILALLVCAKIALYDFRGAATVQKIILFFAVGVISLIIAGIYIILEKKNSSSGKEM